jgi:hypothetical protein
MDSDDEEENYKKNSDDYIKQFLKPSFEPIMIYNGTRFLKRTYIDKYLDLIQQKASGLYKYWRDIGILLDIKHIQQIRKIEIREENR